MIKMATKDFQYTALLDEQLHAFLVFSLPSLFLACGDDYHINHRGKPLSLSTQICQNKHITFPSRY